MGIKRMKFLRVYTRIKFTCFIFLLFFKVNDEGTTEEMIELKALQWKRSR